MLATLWLPSIPAQKSDHPLHAGGLIPAYTRYAHQPGGGCFFPHRIGLICSSPKQCPIPVRHRQVHPQRHRTASIQSLRSHRKRLVFRLSPPYRFDLNYLFFELSSPPSADGNHRRCRGKWHKRRSSETNPTSPVGGPTQTKERYIGSYPRAVAH